MASLIAVGGGDDGHEEEAEAAEAAAPGASSGVMMTDVEASCVAQLREVLVDGHGHGGGQPPPSEGACLAALRARHGNVELAYADLAAGELAAHSGRV
jgi:hypothetical protein